MLITRKEIRYSFDSTKLRKIKNFEKNPLKGGIPLKEKKIIRNEQEFKELTLKNPSKFDKKNPFSFFVSSKLTFI
jgi:hypothetical protein